jgi:hypothetical protein
MAVTINGTDGIETNTDTGKVKLGTDDDLVIEHNGTNSVIDNNTGKLLITSDDIWFKDKDDGDVHAKFIHDDAVELYYNGTKKLSTDTDGIWVSGALRGESVDLADSKKVLLGSGDDLEIYHNGVESVIRDINGSSNIRIQPASAEDGIVLKPNGAVELYYNDTKTFETNSNGVTVTGGAAINHNANVVAGINLKNTVTTGTSINFARADGTVIGSVTNPSDSSTSFNTSSDYRLKENQVAISDGITRLKTLKPYKFNFKGQSEAVDGFFAHEVSPAVPEAITGTKDETYTKDFDSLNMKAGDPKYQQIDQSKLVPLLTAALQEAITKIETLETKVAALEAHTHE